MAKKYNKEVSASCDDNCMKQGTPLQRGVERVKRAKE
jgi:hypothetical protein